MHDPHVESCRPRSRGSVSDLNESISLVAGLGQAGDSHDDRWLWHFTTFFSASLSRSLFLFLLKWRSQSQYFHSDDNEGEQVLELNNGAENELWILSLKFHLDSLSAQCNVINAGFLGIFMVKYLAKKIRHFTSDQSRSWPHMINRFICQSIFPQMSAYNVKS